MTNLTRAGSLRRALILFLVFLFAILPLIARAQTAPPSDLRASIRAELLSDPRTASLSPAQLDAMVSLLAQDAQQQGLTASDIALRPASSPSAGSAASPSSETCNGSFTCMADEAFGFVGPDTSIPFLLGMASMGLIWIIAEMIHRRKYPHLFTSSAQSGGM